MAANAFCDDFGFRLELDAIALEFGNSHLAEGLLCGSDSSGVSDVLNLSRLGPVPNGCHL